MEYFLGISISFSFLSMIGSSIESDLTWIAEDSFIYQLFTNLYRLIEAITKMLIITLLAVQIESK
jgi:hypothetical protein